LREPRSSTNQTAVRESSICGKAATVRLGSVA
jgi:hypothetical protein